MDNNRLQWQTIKGQAIPAGTLTIVPQSQTLRLRLPFVGLLWNHPTAIFVQQGEKTERIVIQDVSGLYLLLAILSALALALILARATNK